MKTVSPDVIHCKLCPNRFPLSEMAAWSDGYLCPTCARVIQDATERQNSAINRCRPVFEHDGWPRKSPQKSPEREKDMLQALQQHTPTPWFVEYDEGEGAHIIRMGEAETSRTTYPCHQIIHYNHDLYPDDGKQFEEAEANAEFIVTAVNLHDELVRALKNTLASAVPNAKEHPTMFAVWADARAVLAKVKS